MRRLVDRKSLGKAAKIQVKNPSLCKTESFAWAGNKRERTQSLGIGDTLR
jgi:hypothetical protein